MDEREMEQALGGLERSVRVREAENALLEKKEAEQRAALEEASGKLRVALEARDFLQRAAEDRRAGTRKWVEELATEALACSHGGDVSLALEATVKRGRSSVEPVIRQALPGGQVVERGSDGVGGGVLDSVAAPIRLAVVAAAGVSDRVVVLDEPLKHADPERSGRAGEFLAALCERLGCQVLMVSHDAQHEEAATTVHLVRAGEGEAEVERQR